MAAQSMSQKTLHLVIRGRVQGVYFRDSMRREAQKLGVSGWVRNCDDGSVEAAVQGAPAAVDAIVSWARRGPDYAEVDDISIEPHAGNYSSFEIISY